MGLTLFALGLFKKVIFADGMAVYASAAFLAAENGVILTIYEAWLGSLAYTMQLYFDFSGYSDMALGLAIMFGFRLPVNFFSPRFGIRSQLAISYITPRLLAAPSESCTEDTASSGMTVSVAPLSTASSMHSHSPCDITHSPSGSIAFSVRISPTFS